MPAGDCQAHAAVQLATAGHVALIAAVHHFGVFGPDVAAVGEAEGDDLAVQSFHRAAAVGVVAVDDDHAVFRRQQGKFAERGDDVIRILKKVQMIPVNVEDDRYRGVERMERVLIFAGLCHEQAAVSDAQGAADGGQIAAYHDGGVHAAGLGKGGDHGGGRGLSMGAGHTHHLLIMLHDKAPGLCPGDDGNAGRPGGHDLRVVIPDGGGADDQRGLAHIVGAVADGHGNAHFVQTQRIDGAVPVAAPDVCAHVLEHLGQRPHGNAADADQVDGSAGMKNFRKVQIVHAKTFLNQSVYGCSILKKR